jgi:hypothetical protein
VFILTILSLFIDCDSFLLGDRNMHYHYVNFHFVVYLGALILSFSALKKDPDLKKKVLLILFSFLMLFVGSIGTNGYLTTTFLGYMSFVYLSLFFVLRGLEKEIKIIFLFFVLFVSIYQIKSGVYDFPYRQIELSQQTNRIKNSNSLRGLSLDSNLRDLIGQLDYLKEKNIASVFTYNYHLGLCLIIEKEPYAFGWISDGNDKVNAVIIEKSKNKLPNAIVFILPDYAPLNSLVIEALKDRSVYFEKDYRLNKQIEYFDYTTNKNEILNIYLHKDNL